MKNADRIENLLNLFSYICVHPVNLRLNSSIFIFYLTVLTERRAGKWSHSAG
jgi:hypothetical protein